MYVNGSYRSEFKDVYEGYHLEIQVVDHCNLNCSGCNHFSPLANKWFMSVEEFVENLVLVSQKLPSISTLMILGGEPTLHPQLGDLCMLARTIFPTIPITILTNGVALKDWTQEQYETLEQYRVALGVSKYYGQDYEWMSAARA